MNWFILVKINYSQMCFSPSNSMTTSNITLWKLVRNVDVVLSHIRLFVSPWTLAHQALLSMEISSQEYWSRLPFPTPGDLPNPGIKFNHFSCGCCLGRHILYHWATWEALSTTLYVRLSPNTQHKRAMTSLFLLLPLNPSPHTPSSPSPHLLVHFPLSYLSPSGLQFICCWCIFCYLPLEHRLHHGRGIYNLGRFSSVKHCEQ